MNTNCFFSNFSGTAGISRPNPGISRQKSLISLASRDIPNFLAPTPSRARPLPHRKISGLKSLGLGSFFVPEERPQKRAQSFSWNSPREYSWDPYDSRHLKPPEPFQRPPPLSTAGEASFLRSGFGESLSELVMEFPAILRVFLGFCQDLYS